MSETSGSGNENGNWLVEKFKTAFSKKAAKSDVPMSEDNRVLKEIASENASNLKTSFELVLEKAKKKTKESGVIASSSLTLRDRDGQNVECVLRYTLGEVGDSPAGRFEIFEGEPPKGTDFSINTFESKTEDIEQDKKPIAFRQIWFKDLQSVDPEVDGITITGFVHTREKWQGLGISTSLMKLSIEQEPIKDFVYRIRKHISRSGINSFNGVILLISDMTYYHPNRPMSRGWSERLARSLGFVPADEEKYPSLSKDVYAKKIDLR